MNLSISESRGSVMGKRCYLSSALILCIDVCIYVCVYICGCICPFPVGFIVPFPLSRPLEALTHLVERGKMRFSWPRRKGAVGTFSWAYGTQVKSCSTSFRMDTNFFGEMRIRPCLLFYCQCPRYLVATARIKNISASDFV